MVEQRVDVSQAAKAGGQDHGQGFEVHDAEHVVDGRTASQVDLLPEPGLQEGDDVDLMGRQEDTQYMVGQDLRQQSPPPRRSSLANKGQTSKYEDFVLGEE